MKKAHKISISVQIFNAISWASVSNTYMLMIKIEHVGKRFGCLSVRAKKATESRNTKCALITNQKLWIRIYSVVRVWRIMMEIWQQNWSRKSAIFQRTHNKNTNKWKIHGKMTQNMKDNGKKTTVDLMWNCMHQFNDSHARNTQCSSKCKQKKERELSQLALVWMYTNTLDATISSLSVTFRVYKKVIIMIIIKIKIKIIIKLSS